MRKHIPYLKTSSMPWTSPRPGTSAKLLSVNEDKPAATVLLCFDPEGGYEDQPSPHYHEGLEELLILDGKLSFDSKTWLHRGGYVYHPPFYVHGFASRVATRTTLLARSEGPIETKFISKDSAEDTYPYQLSDTVSAGALNIVPSPWAFRFEPVEAEAGDILQYTYSMQEDTGAITQLREFAPHVKERAPGMVPNGMAEEIFVLSGELTDETGQVFRDGDFACFPAGMSRSALTARERSEVLVSMVAD